MEMISKKQEKLILALKRKKERASHALYLIEGEKLHQEAMSASVSFHSTFTSNENFKVLAGLKEVYFATEVQMKKLSSLNTPPGLLSIVEMPKRIDSTNADFLIYLDQINDPGNLGTILRSAEAFGVEAVICSVNTVDVFNSKVVQSSMGSIFRMPILTESDELINQLSQSHQWYGTHLKGENLYQTKITKPAVVVMGSESHGISERILNRIDYKVKIPIKSSVESLNVSMATAVVLAEFNRRFLAQ